MADPILVVVFLRGGVDGLNLVGPSGDPDYISARPERLRVLRRGDDAGHALSDQVADVDFRFHAMAGPLSELFEARELAVIHAAGLTDGTRSHFDAEDRMERAADGGVRSGGWIGRWLAASAPQGALPALAAGSGLPESLRGWNGVAVAEELSQLILAEGHDFASFLSAGLHAGFGRNPLMSPPVNRLLSLSAMLRDRLRPDDAGADYKPSTDYPDGIDLSRSLMTVAQAIKLDLGLRVATVDYGGWDTHDAQADDFGRLTDGLSRALMAFWRDLGSTRDRVTVVVMSEFGRRLRANRNLGTDHGFGNAMLVLGGGVSGGRMLGAWPGLSNDALDDGVDLAITTDYRHVLAEVMTRHMGADADVVFPGFVPEWRGVFA